MGFTSEGKLKILDFGLSRIIESSSPLSDEVYEMTGGTGSLRYMAPEVANSYPYNHKADVHSFGILLWELLSCKKPFVDLKYKNNIDAFYEEIVNGGARPPIDNKWPKELVILMERCWSSDFDKRPSFSEIVDILNTHAHAHAHAHCHETASIMGKFCASSPIVALTIMLSYLSVANPAFVIMVGAPVIAALGFYSCCCAAEEADDNEDDTDATVTMDNDNSLSETVDGCVPLLVCRDDLKGDEVYVAIPAVI